MAAQAASAAEARPLPLPRLRRDLEMEPQYFRGRLSYVVKDPVRLNYFRVGQLEYLIMRAMQEGTTREQLHQRIKAHTGIDLTDRMLQDAVRSLALCNFLVTRGTLDADRLFKSRRSRWKSRLLTWFSNYLFIQFPLWNPDTTLDRLMPYFRWLWGRTFFALWLTVVVSAVYIVVSNFGTLISGAFSLLSGWNLLVLSAAIFSTKFFHEMGHGLCCKNFGGEVHEMGFALLVFNPCMYCDASDAWRFANKWHRMLVGASGMFVEIFLAAIAAFAWMLLEPGFGKTFCYATMVTCSISTVLFNANPLLRYDGYYILSDYLEIPNLRQRTQEYIGYLFNRYALGSDVPEPDLTGRDKAVYVSYAVPAFLYRLLVLTSIAMLLFHLFAPMGIMMMCSTAYGMFITPTYKAAKKIWRSRSGKERKRFVLFLAMVGLVLVGLWMIPVQYCVKASCAVVPTTFTIVRTPIRGRVVKVHVEEGQAVGKGDLLAEVENREWTKRAESLNASINAIDAKIRSALVDDPSVYATLKLERSEILAEIEVLKSEIASGLLRAPHDGCVCKAMPPETAMRPAGYLGMPFFDDPLGPSPDAFEGLHLEVGDGLLCIADRRDGYRFHMLVREDDMRRLRRDLPVEVKLSSLRRQEFKAQVVDIAPAEEERIENIGLTVADEGSVPVERESAEPAPLIQVYLVEAEPRQQFTGMRWGMTGKARIVYDRGPVGSYYLGKLIHKLYKKWHRVR